MSLLAATTTLLQGEQPLFIGCAGAWLQRGVGVQSWRGAARSGRSCARACAAAQEAALEATGRAARL